MTTKTKIYILFTISFLIIFAIFIYNKASNSPKIEKEKITLLEQSNNDITSEKIKIKHIKDTLLNHSELIYDFEFYLSNKSEDWYSKNNQKKINSDYWTLAQIYSNPDTKSKIIGELVTYYDTLVSNFIIQIKSTNGKVLKEFREIGDWGYGIHINTIAYSSNFVQLPNKYFEKEAWVSLKKMNNQIQSYVGRLVSLSSNILINKKTGKESEIKKGIYLIEKIENKKFIIRKEIPEDMPCGDETIITKDINKIPRYYLNIQSLEMENGDFDIRIAYSKGC